MEKFQVKQSLTIRNSKSINSYLAEINGIKMFSSPDAEAECAFKAHDGDKAALEELVQRNLKFVVSVAKQYETHTTPLIDLINVGNMGLIEAANRFDPTTGYKFISYAVWWVRKEILEYLGNFDNQIRIPINRFNDNASFKKKKSQLEQKLGREVTDGDFMDEYKIDEDELNILKSLDGFKPNSLSKPLSDDRDANTIEELLSSDESFSADSLLMDNEKHDFLNTLLGKLNPIQARVIVLYYGINRDYGLNLNEIGTELGVSRERIRQIRDKALRTMKLNARFMGVTNFSL